MISKSILRHSIFSTQVAVVRKHAREVDTLHMIPRGIPSEKPLVADGAETVRDTLCLHRVLAHKLVEFFWTCKVSSKSMACILRQMK